jgi:ANTAR domain
VEPGSGKPRSLDAARAQALWEQSRALRLLSEQARARARATREQILAGRSQREILHDSAFARLVAKQETMLVIEQAKGIIMAQQRCGPEEAFDLLRQASQRTNIKVHVLAARIVEQTTASDDAGNVIPISLGARRYQRPQSRAQPSSG